MPDDLIDFDYQLWQCSICELVHASPSVPGSSEYYSWITKTSNYYQAHRWEWSKFTSLVPISRDCRLLEIGCGTGSFLKFLHDTTGVQGIGLDMYAPSIQTARSRGVKAYQGDLASFSKSNPSTRFDVVCMFHCLEHVRDPLDEIKLINALLAPGGTIALSVPYSPTSHEVLGWQCMNLPPHHLTRWNDRSLREMGEQAGLELDLHTDEGLFQSSRLKSLYWAIGNAGKRSEISCQHWLHRALTLTWLGWKYSIFVLQRPKLKGQPAGDVALALFRRASDLIH